MGNNYSAPSAGSSIDSNSSPYTSKPLRHADSIRVLTLLPETHTSAEIRCSLEVTRLSHLSQGRSLYTTLSYVWGSEKDAESAVVDGHHLSIGRNLASALRHLRYPHKPARLWVDAICIDQNSIAERNHQVQQMRDIYAASTETIVYLGDDDNGNTSIAAWNFLQRHSEWAADEFGNKDYEIPSMLENTLLDFRGDMYDIDIDVLPRPWFTRVWVLQEVVVSKSVSIQSGRRRIPWDDFCKVLFLHPRHHDRYGTSLHTTDKLQTITEMFQARLTYQAAHGLADHRPDGTPVGLNRPEGGASLVEMLTRARSLKSTDPRDKIFAVLGIASDLGTNGLEVTVDYQKSPRQVYVDFARNFMETCCSLDLLSHVNHAAWASHYTWSGSNERLPTWVPNWDGSGEAKLHYGLFTSKRDAVEENYYSELNSSGEYGDYPGPPPLSFFGPTFLSTLPVEDEAERVERGRVVSSSVRWNSDDSRLVVLGAGIGEVVHIGPPLVLRPMQEDSFQAIRDNTSQDERKMRAEIIKAWRDVLWRKENPEREILESAPIWMRQKINYRNSPRRKSMQEAYERLKADFAPHSIEDHLFERGKRTIAWSGTDWEASNFVQDSSSAVDGKAFGIYLSKDDGKEHNVVLPSEASSGDLIVSLRGARVPFAVRPLQGAHGVEDWNGLLSPILPAELVGECLINDFDGSLNQEYKDIITVELV